MVLGVRGFALWDNVARSKSTSSGGKSKIKTKLPPEVAEAVCNKIQNTWGERAASYDKERQQIEVKPEYKEYLKDKLSLCAAVLENANTVSNNSVIVNPEGDKIQFQLPNAEQLQNKTKERPEGYYTKKAEIQSNPDFGKGPVKIDTPSILGRDNIDNCMNHFQNEVKHVLGGNGIEFRQSYVKDRRGYEDKSQTFLEITRNGKPLTEKELQLVHRMGMEFGQSMNDMSGMLQIDRMGNPKMEIDSNGQVTSTLPGTSAEKPKSQSKSTSVAPEKRQTEKQPEKKERQAEKNDNLVEFNTQGIAGETTKFATEMNKQYGSPGKPVVSPVAQDGKRYIQFTEHATDEQKQNIMTNLRDTERSLDPQQSKTNSPQKSAEQENNRERQDESKNKNKNGNDEGKQPDIAIGETLKQALGGKRKDIEGTQVNLEGLNDELKELCGKKGFENISKMVANESAVIITDTEGNNKRFTANEFKQTYGEAIKASPDIWGQDNFDNYFKNANAASATQAKSEEPVVGKLSGDQKHALEQRLVGGGVPEPKEKELEVKSMPPAKPEPQAEKETVQLNTHNVRKADTAFSTIINDRYGENTVSINNGKLEFGDNVSEQDRKAINEQAQKQSAFLEKMGALTQQGNTSVTMGQNGEAVITFENSTQKFQYMDKQPQDQQTLLNRANSGQDVKSNQLTYPSPLSQAGEDHAATQARFENKDTNQQPPVQGARPIESPVAQPLANEVKAEGNNVGKGEQPQEERIKFNNHKISGATTQFRDEINQQYGKNVVKFHKKDDIDELRFTENATKQDKEQILALRDQRQNELGNIRQEAGKEASLEMGKNGAVSHSLDVPKKPLPQPKEETKPEQRYTNESVCRFESGAQRKYFEAQLKEQYPDATLETPKRSHVDDGSLFPKGVTAAEAEKINKMAAEFTGSDTGKQLAGYNSYDPKTGKATNEYTVEKLEKPAPSKQEVQQERVEAPQAAPLDTQNVKAGATKSIDLSNTSLPKPKEETNYISSPSRISKSGEQHDFVAGCKFESLAQKQYFEAQIKEQYPNAKVGYPGGFTDYEKMERTSGFNPDHPIIITGVNEQEQIKIAKMAAEFVESDTGKKLADPNVVYNPETGKATVHQPAPPRQEVQQEQARPAQIEIDRVAEPVAKKRSNEAVMQFPADSFSPGETFPKKLERLSHGVDGEMKAVPGKANHFSMTFNNDKSPEANMEAMFKKMGIELKEGQPSVGKNGELVYNLDPEQSRIFNQKMGIEPKGVAQERGAVRERADSAREQIPPAGREDKPDFSVKLPDTLPEGTLNNLNGKTLEFQSNDKGQRVNRKATFSQDPEDPKRFNVTVDPPVSAQHNSMVPEAVLGAAGISSATLKSKTNENGEREIQLDAKQAQQFAQRVNIGHASYLDAEKSGPATRAEAIEMKDKLVDKKVDLKDEIKKAEAGVDAAKEQEKSTKKDVEEKVKELEKIEKQQLETLKLHQKKELDAEKEVKSKESKVTSLESKRSDLDEQEKNCKQKIEGASILTKWMHEGDLQRIEKKKEGQLGGVKGEDGKWSYAKIDEAKTNVENAKASHASAKEGTKFVEGELSKTQGQIETEFGKIDQAKANTAKAEQNVKDLKAQREQVKVDLEKVKEQEPELKKQEKEKQKEELKAKEKQQKEERDKYKDERKNRDVSFGGGKGSGMGSGGTFGSVGNPNIKLEDAKEVKKSSSVRSEENIQKKKSNEIGG